VLNAPSQSVNPLGRSLPPRWEGWILAGVIVAWLCISLPSLLSYPTPHADESLFGSVAYNVMNSGSFGIPIYGDVLGVRENFLLNGRFYMASLAAWFYFFGVSLFSARLFSVLAAVVTTLLIWLTARNMMDGWHAILAAALFLFAWKTFYASHRVRPDIWMAFAGILVLWVYTLHPQRYGWLGLTAGLITNIHIPAGFFAAAIAPVLMVDLAGKKIQLASFIKFSIGLVAGAGLWLTFFLIPNPARTVWQFQGGFAGIAQGSAVNLNSYSMAGRLANAWLNFREGFWSATRFSWLEVLVIVLGLAVLLVKRHRSENRSLLLYFAGTIVAMVFSPYLRPYYLVMLMPILALIIARAAYQLSNTRSPYLSHLLILPLLAVYCLGDGILAWQSRDIAYDHYTQKLKALVPPGTHVFGDGALWFEFYDQPFTTDLYINYADVQSINRLDWLRTFLKTEQIEIIIWSDQLAPWSVSSEKPLSDYLNEMLHERCHQRGVVEERFYSVDRGDQPPRRFEVWQCPVEDPAPP
jgi:4-amino-4-deoxy-L-arabinose transferase-like glycosyltransferase